MRETTCYDGIVTTANLENSKRLFELAPGWDDTHYFWHSNKRYEGGKMTPKYDLCFVEMHLGDGDMALPDYKYDLPAPDLGWLLRKLPNQTYVQKQLDRWVCDNKIGGMREDGQYGYFAEADAPEDAACLLLIELIERGVVTL